MFGLSYWLLPLIAAAVWLATLLGMLGTWLARGSPRYVSMEPGQTIAYISDIGATNLQPLFIAGSAVSVVIFDVCFVSERWLRHKGRLAHNTSTTQKVLSGFACAFAIIGAIGLILLTILDTVDHPTAHDICLVVFIVGYIISAIFACAEYQRLGMHFRQHRILRASFWIKLTFIFIEIALAIAFASLGRTATRRNIAAILEWVISLIYIIYQAHYAMDFFPAIHSKNNRFPSVEEMIENGGNGPSYSGGPTFSESASYASENPMRANGQTVEPSRNF
ncbi:putative FK506 suppressor Sfk1 [Aureobasidium sp. EXF-8845]|nr:putative FK506 suppressor Sfk1 [Aureobasidium sp. EXF-8845]KAI4843638.1 putative FK506 suppressor Sfk1 [Aureobasidium sp. EXF-8846]